jgi:hypothetical protein
MKIRAIGTGSKFCRHPLVPSCWLVTSGSDLTLIGAPWPVVPALERYGYSVNNLAVITLLSPQTDQIAGLVELAVKFKGRMRKPILAGPARLIDAVRPRLEHELGFFLDESFDVKSVVRLSIREEYFTETISFVPNYLDPLIPSYGLRFDAAKVFISGETALNEDWLFKEMGSDLILHACRTKSNMSRAAELEDLQLLPLYLQNRMWLYGYDAEEQDAEQPFPMLYLPPGSWVFDSERRDKILSKERFIRENAKKQI